MTIHPKKQIHDILRDNPDLTKDEYDQAFAFARHGQNTGIDKDEVSADILAAICTTTELDELVKAGVIGPNKRLRTKHLI